MVFRPWGVRLSVRCEHRAGGLGTFVGFPAFGNPSSSARPCFDSAQQVGNEFASSSSYFAQSRVMLRDYLLPVSQFWQIGGLNRVPSQFLVYS